jgi:glycosyltransferase involved in cell wall biosynthesis
MKLSTIIITNKKSEELENLLKSVDFSDEIILVQDGNIPEDQNQDSAASIRIYQHPLNNNFAEQRNFGLKKARNNWVLFLDDDEEVPKELKKEILDLKFKADVYYLKRRDFFWGRELKYGETRKIRNKGLIRLVKKDAGKWQGKVHEEFKITSSHLKIGRLKNYLNHYPHPTIKSFIEKINYYSSLRADELIESGEHFSLVKLLVYPPAKFILNYIFYLGFLDGPEGFIYAFLMSFHSFLTRAKLYKHG